jgi:RNA polymerase sigma factor (sigma-70 family)
VTRQAGLPGRGSSASRGTSSRARCGEAVSSESRDHAPATTEPDETWLVDLNDAFASLPDSQQEALRLRFEDDLGYDELATRLDTTPAAARVRVHRGLTSLRSLLADPKETRR